MNKLATSKEIQEIINCYSALGDKKLKIGNSFEYYHCPLWRNSAMSPIFISNSRSWEKEISKIEAAFKKPVEKSPFSSQAPYFNLLTKGKAPLDKKLIARLEKAGWNERKTEVSLNIWKKQIPLEIPKGYHVKVGNYFDPSLYKDFLKTMVDNFSTDEVFRKYLNRMLKTIEKDVLTVLLYKNDKVVGGTLVAVKNGSAYLLCGSIMKAYRGKRLWKVINASAQAASSGKGAKTWSYTTAAPNLLWDGDETYRTSIFIKT